MNEPAGPILTPELSRVLGVRRTALMQRIIRRTGQPPEALLDLALRLLDIASDKFGPSPIHRTAVALGTARWRNVSPEKRTEILRRAAQARWARHRERSGDGGDDS